MKNYHTATQEDYNALMIELENKGCMWYEEKPTAKNYWPKNEEKTYVMEENGYLTYGRMEPSYRELYPFIDYKAKGENMLNTECKQCHKKWHHDNAKYCSMCGKKLVAEAEFKVGDYVKNDPWIGKVEEKGMNILIGSYYDKENNKILSNFYAVDCDETQHATPEEIAEYESALTFHKHGRKPFEVKEGDLIKTSSGQNIIAYYPENFSKVNFLKRGWKLLKTAEEVNEWLGVSDE